MAGVVRRPLKVVLVVGLLVVLVAVAVNVALVSRLDRIEGAFAGLSGRPPAADGETVLVVATRSAGSGADVPWLAGEQSVEAVLLIEVPPGAMSAEVAWLPAGSGVREAAATPAPSASVATVEEWSGRRVDHLVAVDWDTFVRLADDNGVDATYAYGSAPAVQREYLRQVLEGTLHAELRKRPLDLLRLLRTTAAGTAVDDDWSVAELDLAVLSLRSLRTQEITFSAARPG